MTREEWENEMVEITDQRHVLRREIDEIRDPKLHGSTYAEQKVSGSAGETIEYHRQHPPNNRDRTIWCARKDHPDYAKMTYEKKPQAGEWWELEDEGRVYFVGYDHEGDPVYIRNNSATPDTIYMNAFIREGKHLPDCTGWDWEPPKPVPVATESPEDWVVQDRVPARAGVDRGWWIVEVSTLPHNKSKCWEVRIGSVAEGMRHGEKDDDGVLLNVFCQRKDLPPLEPEQETLVFHECIVRLGDNSRLSIIQTTDINYAKRYWSCVVPTGNTSTRSIPKGTL